MPKFIDLTGRRFNKLTVLKRGDASYCNHITWLCKCDCGKEKILDACSLKKAKSCGCEWKFEEGLAAFNHVLRAYKKRALKLGVSFDLTLEVFKKITQENCYYCNQSPLNRMQRENYNGDFVYNGIDRVDNSRGYSVDNVVPCCRQCNVAKKDYSIDEFKNWLEKIVNHNTLGLTLNKVERNEIF